jgi:hypothetical protein
MNNKNNHPAPYLKSLATCKKGIAKSGYTEDFVIRNSFLLSNADNKIYDLKQVRVLSVLHFEGSGHNDEHADLYIIETSDGVKGTYLDEGSLPLRK